MDKRGKRGRAVERTRARVGAWVRGGSHEGGVIRDMFLARLVLWVDA